MRKVLISVAAAGSALAFAAPAAAQYLPAPTVPYGNAYGYQNNWGQVRSLQARLDNVERRIDRADRRNIIRGKTAERLREEAYGIERRLRKNARYGLNPYEANDVQVRIARLEQRLQWAMNERGNRYGWNGADRDGRDVVIVDRDRDGRDDRWEREHSRDRDDDRDDD